jgi:hypothetical protein
MQCPHSTPAFCNAIAVCDRRLRGAKHWDPSTRAMHIVRDCGREAPFAGESRTSSRRRHRRRVCGPQTRGLCSYQRRLATHRRQCAHVQAQVASGHISFLQMIFTGIDGSPRQRENPSHICGSHWKCSTCGRALRLAFRVAVWLLWWEKLGVRKPKSGKQTVTNNVSFCFRF